jgi:thiol-disulfide isomerase/thioredoxin
MNGWSLRNSFTSAELFQRGRRGATAVLAGLVLAAGGSVGWAQSVAPSALPSSPAAAFLPVIEGKTIDSKPFKLSMLKGKVVLVMFWSTGCAVCRDKMPELRENYAGWNGKPFELVAVNTDVSKKDFMEYERIIASTVPARQRFVQLWTGESGYLDSFGSHPQLPEAFLIDKTGKLVERYVGRIPPETWDRIADLL